MYCTVYGYGFVFDKEELQLELVMDFILHHAKVFQRTDEETQLVELMRELKGQQAAGEDISEDLEAEMEDMELYYQDDSSRQHGIGAVLATIMRRETGLRFQYWPDCEGYSTEPAVLWKATYPWEMNEKEKDLKEHRLYDICRAYMEELGLDDDPEELEQIYPA